MERVGNHVRDERHRPYRGALGSNPRAVRWDASRHSQPPSIYHGVYIARGDGVCAGDRGGHRSRLFVRLLASMESPRRRRGARVLARSSIVLDMGASIGEDAVKKKAKI